MKLFKYIFLFLFLLGATSFQVFASIDLTVSPIKYEINAYTGSTITKTAKLINNTANDFIIETGKSDFTVSGFTGKPKFVRKSELVFPNQQLSTWIDIDTTEFNLPAHTEKEITFFINIPSNATPGGHYGAVFFKNNNSKEGTSGTDNIGINIDYGVIILVNVDGDIVTKGTLGDININNGGNKFSALVKDDCFGLDFTQSYYDGKCYDNPFQTEDPIEVTIEPTPEDNSQPENNSSAIDTTNPISQDDTPGEVNTPNIPNNNNTQPIVNPKQDTKINNNNNNNSNSNEEEIEYKSALDLLIDVGESTVDFNIPFINEGNTHLKPTGGIVLTDEFGNILRGVGKKIVQNNLGVIIGEEIVDYLPVNDIEGNVLPYSTRIFDTVWKGFPYKSFDENGNPEIKFWSPSEYYTKKNLKENNIVMFRERVMERVNHKKLTAIIRLSYTNHNGEIVEFNTTEDFYIDYKENYIGYNYYVLVGMALLLLLGFFWFIILWKRKKRCEECNEKVEKDMVVCPYCSHILRPNQYKTKLKKGQIHK